MTRSSALAALLGCVSSILSPRPMVAQAVLSAGRGVTLVAIKPAVEPFDVVRLRPMAPMARNGANPEIRMAVDVRDDGPCDIEVELAEPATHARVRVRDGDGDAHALIANAIRVFHGWCRASAPEHILSVIDDRATSDSAQASVDLSVRVVTGRGDQLRRWIASVRVPLRSPAR